MLLDLSNENRDRLTRQKALVRDDHGNEIFIGLTHGESYRYQLLSDPWRENTIRDAAEFLLLDKKHEIAMREARFGNAVNLLDTPNVGALKAATDA